MTELYLDSSIFITWLQKGKKDTIEFYQAVKQLIQEIEENKYQIITSTILITEVFNHKTHELDIEHFDKIINSPTVRIQAVDIRVAHTARKLRSDFNIHTPDAIHLATAILYKADYFCTKDDKLLALAPKIKETKIVKLPPLD